MKKFRELQKKEQTARKRLERNRLEKFKTREQTARKELERFRTRSKPLERDYRISKKDYRT